MLIWFNLSRHVSFIVFIVYYGAIHTSIYTDFFIFEYTFYPFPPPPPPPPPRIWPKFLANFPEYHTLQPTIVGEGNFRLLIWLTTSKPTLAPPPPPPPSNTTHPTHTHTHTHTHTLPLPTHVHIPHPTSSHCG